VGVEVAAHGRIGEAARFSVPINVTGATCVQGWRARGSTIAAARCASLFPAGALEGQPRHRPRITYMTLFASGCVKLRTVLLCRRYALRSRKCSGADLEATGMVCLSRPRRAPRAAARLR
jgi:hypothetical protein